MKLTLQSRWSHWYSLPGTTTICMSGAVNEHHTEYGGMNATMEQLFNPT